MKRLFICTLLAGALFISCEKSENGSQIGDRLVKSVEIIIPDEGIITYDFRYNDKNKLSEMSIFYDGNEITHSEYYYSDNTIIMNSNEEEEWEYVWKLNSRRQINQLTYNVDYGVMTTDYYYDGDGLLSYKEKRYHEDDYSCNEKISYTRKDGNVITSTYFYNGNEKFKEYFTYTDNINKANLDLLAIISRHFCEAGYPCNFYELDRSVFTSFENRNLLRTYQYEDYDYSVVNLNYDFDKDGYIVKIDAYYADDNELCVSAKVNYL